MVISSRLICVSKSLTELSSIITWPTSSTMPCLQKTCFASPFGLASPCNLLQASRKACRSSVDSCWYNSKRSMSLASLCLFWLDCISLLQARRNFRMLGSNDALTCLKKVAAFWLWCSASFNSCLASLVASRFRSKVPWREECSSRNSSIWRSSFFGELARWVKFSGFADSLPTGAPEMKQTWLDSEGSKKTAQWGLRRSPTWHFFFCFTSGLSKNDVMHVLPSRVPPGMEQKCLGANCWNTEYIWIHVKACAAFRSSMTYYIKIANLYHLFGPSLSQPTSPVSSLGVVVEGKFACFASMLCRWRFRFGGFCRFRSATRTLAQEGFN